MNDIDEGRIYECDECELKTFSCTYLAAHKRNKHEFEGTIYNCDQCNKSYSFEWSLQIHKRNIHNPVEVPCKYCNFIGRHQQNLAYHIKAKHKDNINLKKCDKCSFTTLADCALKRHEIKKHTNQFLKCQYSGCKFDTLFENKMSAHISKFHMKRKCSYCDFVIPTNYRNQDARMRTHNYRNHYDEMKIICVKCSFSTISKVQLSIHSFKHHEDPIICSYCQDKMDSISMLKEHLKSKHRKFYSCNKCDFFDARRYLLEIHKYKKNQHSIEPNERIKKVSGEKSTNITTKNRMKIRKRRCKRCGLEFDHGWTLFHHKNSCTMIDHTSKNKVSQDIGNTSSVGQQDNVVMEKSFDIKTQRVSWRCKNCHYACNDKAKTRRHIKARHLPNYEKGEQSNEDPLSNEPSESLSKICKDTENEKEKRSDNDNNSEHLLSRLNESLKNEISFLDETFPSENNVTENSETKEYFQMSNEIDQKCDITIVKHVNHPGDLNFDNETQDPLSYPSHEICQDQDSLKYYVCPLDSCTFMTSELTIKIIREHFSVDHPGHNENSSFLIL